jgi:hypothetical protein
MTMPKKPIIAPVVKGEPVFTLKGLRLLRSKTTDIRERERLDAAIKEKEERARAFLSAHGMRVEKG